MNQTKQILTSSSLSQSPSQSRHTFVGEHPFPESTSVFSNTESRPWITETTEPLPPVPLFRPRFRRLSMLPGVAFSASSRTDICGRAVDVDELPAFKSAPRRRDAEDASAFPEALWPSFFLVLADAAQDVPQLHNIKAADVTASSVLVRDIRKRIVVVVMFCSFVNGDDQHLAFVPLRPQHERSCCR